MSRRRWIEVRKSQGKRFAGYWRLGWKEITEYARLARDEQVGKYSVFPLTEGQLFSVVRGFHL